MARVDFVKKIELGALILARDVLRPGEVENRSARRTEERALIAGGQKAGAPIERPALDALIVAEDDIARKVLALASQPIGNPCSRARKTGTRDASVDLIKRVHVIIRFAVA